MEKNKTISEIIFGEKPKTHKILYNKNKKNIYYENWSGFWEKKLYNNQNDKIYFELSNGYIFDNRPIPNKTISEIIFGGKPYDNITNYIAIYNKKKRNIYTEYFDGSWYKTLYNNQNDKIYFENSNGYINDNRLKPNKTISEIIFGKKPGFNIYLFNKNKIDIYYETFIGFWWKTLYDNKNQQIYYENSNGIIEDNRPKPNKTIAEIIFGKKPEIYIFLFNKNEYPIYYEESDSFWFIRLYSDQNQEIYFENSLGIINDKRN